VESNGSNELSLAMGHLSPSAKCKTREGNKLSFAVISTGQRNE
jgi:hypothetical protein